MVDNQMSDNQMSDKMLDDQNSTTMTCTDYLCVPFIYVYLFFEFVYGCLQTAILGVYSGLDYAYVIPYFNPKALLIWKSPVGLMSLREFNYKYWSVMLLLAYFTYYPNPISWGFQRSVNMVREACFCDMIKMTSSSYLVEGVWLVTIQDRWSQASYLFRRFLCNLLHLM